MNRLEVRLYGGLSFRAWDRKFHIWGGPPFDNRDDCQEWVDRNQEELAEEKL
jgi:hypothetical protein